MTPGYSPTGWLTRGDAAVRRPRATTLAVIASALVLTTSGCSTFNVHVDEADSTPVRVGVVETPSSTAEPTPTDQALPEGMRREPVDLGPHCPFTVELGIDDGWHDDTAIDGFRLYSRDGGALLNVNCSEERGSTVDEIIDDARKPAYSDLGSALDREKLGTVPAGRTWSHLGELGPGALRAIDDEPTRYGGAVIGAQKAGRTYSISIELMVKVVDDANADLIAQTLPTLTLDGMPVPPPALG